MSDDELAALGFRRSAHPVRRITVIVTDGVDPLTGRPPVHPADDPIARAAPEAAARRVEAAAAGVDPAAPDLPPPLSFAPFFFEARTLDVTRTARLPVPRTVDLTPDGDWPDEPTIVEDRK